MVDTMFIIINVYNCHLNTELTSETPTLCCQADTPDESLANARYSGNGKHAINKPS